MQIIAYGEAQEPPKEIELGTRAARLIYDPEVRWLNHRSFRFPAKFHPPVAKALVEQFSSAGDLVLDPFCGSGTALIEAMVAGRNCLGFDLDPLSVFVSQAKTRLYNPAELTRQATLLCARLRLCQATHLSRDDSFHKEISKAKYKARLHDLGQAPVIPNLFHWFRRRVVLQLIEIRASILEVADDCTTPFFHLCFASIIRNASNADPVPVSGVEVTAHMRRLEKEGRSIDPFDLMIRAVRRNLAATINFINAMNGQSLSARVFCRNAAMPWVENIPKADVVITSPPYLNAVDYYRRHQLEMYWLGLVESHEDRLQLLPDYIGRAKPSRRALGSAERVSPSKLELMWTKRLVREAPHRVAALQHYAATMQTALSNQHKALKQGGLLVLVVGDSRISGRPFPTSRLLKELCGDYFTLVGRYCYFIKNRYMSYSRHNGADISKDTVLVLERR